MQHMPVAAERTSRPIRVLVLLGNWIGGGAERVAMHLMQRLPAHWEVHLGLLHAGSIWLDELDPARVHLAPLGARRFRFDRPNAELFEAATLLNGAVHGPRALRRMIRDIAPDVVLSFLKGTAILTWLALAGLRQRPRWIAREGNNVFATAAHESPGPLVRAVSLGLTGMAYRRADAVLTNARAMADDLIAGLRLDRQKVHTIANPVDCEQIAAAARAWPEGAPDRPFLIAAGRLEYQKGHDTLLRAFAASAARDTHRLVIVGRGSREGELRRMAAALGLGERVSFVGFLANPHAWTARADLFVLPSRWEGFPNAAAEAAAAGAPLLLADCPYGPREILGTERCGTLFPVDDVAALSGAIDRLLADPGLRARQAAAARVQVRRFGIERIAARYADLIAAVAEPDRAERSLTLAPA